MFYAEHLEWVFLLTLCAYITQPVILYMPTILTSAFFNKTVRLFCLQNGIPVDPVALLLSVLWEISTSVLQFGFGTSIMWVWQTPGLLFEMKIKLDGPWEILNVQRLLNHQVIKKVMLHYGAFFERVPATVVSSFLYAWHVKNDSII